MSDSDQKIIDQLARTSALIERLEKQRYLQIIDQPWRFLLMSFLQGIAVALGSTLGFAVIVWLFAFVLQRLEIIGPLSGTLQDLRQLLESLHR